MKFKDIKSASRKSLKRHYLLYITMMLIAVFLGTKAHGALDILSIRYTELAKSPTARVLDTAIRGDIAGAIDMASDNMITMSDEDKKIGDIELGHSQGILAEIVNKRASGSFIASLAGVILNITNSPSTSGIILMILALIFIAFESIFVSEAYRIVYTRVYLESRIYKRVNFSSFLYLIRTGTWIKSSLAYLRVRINLFLWCFTIVGGIIKYYAYFLVRFILAENPTLSGSEAMKLSERMMKGHKFEVFKLGLSFIGWDILAAFTGNLLTILFVQPYREGAYAEYYARIRELAKQNAIPGAEKLTDEYLYTKAAKELINRTYSHEIEIMNGPDVELAQPTKLRAFFQDVFGLVLTYDAQEVAYRNTMYDKTKVESYKKVINGEAYPIALCPVKSKSNRKHMDHVHYMRHYSLSSLILIFFTFCFVGWLWEVSIHLVNDGRFVNRGVMHGPWLPIYGTGAVMILLVLNRFRKKPALEFMSAILLCGAVEYSGSYLLEKIYDGQKWWDYTGYFLNVNGRICAEGLLVFGIAGIAAVYFIAPLLDNNFLKLKGKIIWPICITLMSAFLCDTVYSHFVPNTGEGITDYAENTTDNTGENAINKTIA